MMNSRSYPASFVVLVFGILIQAAWYPNYYIQAGTPTFTQNFIDPVSGCNWSGIAGQVFDLNGLPVEGEIIEVHGFIEGIEIHFSTTTGSSQQMGPGGYEFQLSDYPIFTLSDLYLQIVDTLGAPLSRRLYFDTNGTCEQNLTIVNVIEFSTAGESYLPAIFYSK
jgi:hypothetical protein